ncbi:MAG: hypothetical protein ACI8RD_006088 [Bacillariaceae sp.]|jgi:hypothetical protein
MLLLATRTSYVHTVVQYLFASAKQHLGEIMKKEQIFNELVVTTTSKKLRLQDQVKFNVVDVSLIDLSSDWLFVITSACSTLLK